jgi:LysM repeat protein
MEVYTVQKGDTFWAIGRKYGFNWRYIAYLNDLSDPNKIYVGQKINVFGNQIVQNVIHLI